MPDFPRQDDFSGSDTAKALWITGPSRCEMRAEPLASPRDGEAFVESRFGAVSRGTERLIFEGRVPASEFDRMRGPHQRGDFPFPVKYGYAVVATVVAGPADLLGRDMFCLHPHQDRFVLPTSDLVPLPQGLSPERAVLAANMETALNIVWDAQIAPGDRLAVVGAGLVGLLVARLASRIPGVEACLVDIDPARSAVAAALGVAFSSPAEAPADRDIVVHCSASEAGLASSIAMAGFEARVVEASWYGDGVINVPLGGAFHSRRLSIVASQVGAVPAARRGRWTMRRRQEMALSLLADDRLDALISGETRFFELPQRYAGILAANNTLCHRIRYG